MISTIRWIVNRRLGFCAGRFVAAVRAVAACACLNSSLATVFRADRASFTAGDFGLERRNGA
jgi:hypothetical protein